MRSSLPFAALLGVALFLGCQDVGTGPDGLVPQFDKKDNTPGRCQGEDPVNGHCHGGDAGDPVVDPGTLFISGSFDCLLGAQSTVGSSKGTVNFNQPRGHSHMHANVQLRGAPDGVYDIYGNHDRVCSMDPAVPPLVDEEHIWVDFLLRSHHDRIVTVANGKGKARIGLDFGGPDNIGGLFSHEVGTHQLWVTLVGRVGGAAAGVVLRSTAVEVVIPEHDDHLSG